MDALLYKVGDVARLASVSVRTLHHYEELGLLVPSGRSDAGHRLYARSDVARLARIKAMTARWALLWSRCARALRGASRALRTARTARTAARALRRGGDDIEHFIETVEVA